MILKFVHCLTFRFIRFSGVIKIEQYKQKVNAISRLTSSIMYSMYSLFQGRSKYNSRYKHKVDLMHNYRRELRNHVNTVCVLFYFDRP